MKRKSVKKIVVNPHPVLEIDQKNGNAYLCINPNTKIVKTNTLSQGPVSIIADFDAKAELIGFEILGMKDLQLKFI